MRITGNLRQAATALPRQRGAVYPIGSAGAQAEVWCGASHFAGPNYTTTRGDAHILRVNLLDQGQYP